MAMSANLNVQPALESLVCVTQTSDPKPERKSTMVTHLTTFASALVSAIDKVDIGRLMNDELSDFCQLVDEVWDITSAQLLGSEWQDMQKWDAVGRDLIPEDAWQRDVLDKLYRTFDAAFWESETREYTIGDSDWNPYDRDSIESYTDSYPHRRSTMPTVDHMTHAQRKRAVRYAAGSSHWFDGTTYDEEIPF